MRWRSVVALALAAVSGTAAAGAETGRVDTIAVVHVSDDAALGAAVQALRDSGGAILLARRVYRPFVVPPRSARPLLISAPRGARVGGVLFDRTQRVTLRGVTITPVGGDALVDVRASSHVVLDDVLVTAQRTPRRAWVHVPDSANVTIRRSRFTHCGDRAPAFTNCVLLRERARNVTIEDNWFHDCFGCDFVHGRFASNLTIRRNRFERALPCSISLVRCGHQDLIELFEGRGLRVERNHFGVYRNGGAQLYITGPTDRVRIANNVFVGTDRRVPRYRARVGLIVGSAYSRRLPYDVWVVNNTILTGHQRRDGYRGSIRMSSLYGAVPRWRRPVLVNNVIALLEVPAHVCDTARASISNVVLRGTGCSLSDDVGTAFLAAGGRPTLDSTLLIDRANRRHATRIDFAGRRRDPSPDIGAYEYRPAR